MAKTTDWGLTDAGFRRPTYAELLDALEYKARELFGSKANLTVRSPLGIFLRIYAWMLNLLFSTLEDVYNSRFVDTAVGHSLYNLGRAIGLRLLGAQKAVGYLTFTGEIGTEVPEGYLAETVAGQQYITLQSGVILDGSITLPASAVVAGPDGNTDAGTITIITNPKTGITAVTNAASFEGGRNTETDDEFRARYYVSTDFAGGVNLDAIIAAIYENVEAVIAVTGEENDTDETNASGLPPHSIELVVYGRGDRQVHSPQEGRGHSDIRQCDRAGGRRRREHQEYLFQPSRAGERLGEGVQPPNRQHLSAGRHRANQAAARGVYRLRHARRLEYRPERHLRGPPDGGFQGPRRRRLRPANQL